MRTTITMSDGLHDELKRRACERDITVSQLVEEFVRLGMDRIDRAKAEKRPFRVPTLGGSGPPPSPERIREVLDEEDIERFRRGGSVPAL